MFWCFGKKPRNYHCKIVLLDETEFIQEIQETSRGQQLLDVVFKHLNLMETAYFGLRFLDSTGQRSIERKDLGISGHLPTADHWLDPNKNIVKQMKDIETFTFYFGVKFYASDPCKLLEEITRYQFFLQVKQDIYQGRLPLTYDLAAELFAYAIQSELGDYDPRRHLPGYAAEFNFTANQTMDLESKAAEIHKGLCGTVPAVAELNFLDRIKWLDMYGVDLHTVLGEDSIEYFLGLTPSGILVLRNKTKVGNYFWPRITKVYYKRKYFMIRVRDKNNEESTYGFELPSKKACKHLWKCCSEHRAFFKLTQVREVPGQSGKIVGLENKFYGKNFQALNMQSRLRTPPTFVRVPSRRFHKRLGQPDGADAKTQTKEEGNAKHILEPSVAMPVIPHNPILIPALHRSTSVPSVVPSPYKVVPAPWEDPRLSNRGLYSSGTNPSPRSVRSAGALPSRRYPLHGRTGSIESTASYDYRKRKHHSRRQSDNESEVSKSSRCSKSSKASRHSHRRHGSQSGGDGSDSETQHRHRRHSRRKKHGSTYELVDSEGQWKEVQRQQELAQARMQNAVVRDLSKRRSGYMNSGLETESETNYNHRRRHRRHRSRSKSPESKSIIPHEVKRYIDYNLIDPSTLTEEEKRDIKYTKIQADSRLFKIRYSSSQGQLHGNTRLSNGSLHKLSLDDPGPPPPYSTDQQNGFLPQSQQRLVDIEEKNESPTENVHISKICTSSPQSSSTSTSSNKARYGGNSSPMLQSPKHSSSQEWNTSKSTLSLNRSQVAPEIGIAPQSQENDPMSQGEQAAKNIRLVNGHFYPASQKSLVTMPTMTHRVTFQNDDASKQYPKTFTSSQSWTQSSPRQNGEVPKSTETKSSQNSHEMSTEL